MSTKISQLPVVSSLTGTELVPIVQGGVTSRTTVSQFLAPVSAPAGSSLVGFQLAATGAAVQTLFTKVSQTVSITDFYANGVSGVLCGDASNPDCTLGIQAAINYVYSIGGGDIKIQGSLKTTSVLQLKPYVRLVGSSQSINSITNTTAGSTLIAFVRPSGYVPSLVLGSGISGITLNGGSLSSNTGIDASNIQAADIHNVEFANCTYGLYFNQASGSSGQSYFNNIHNNTFASCGKSVVFGGAANRNTFTNNTHTNCAVVYDFGFATNVSETNLFINENVEGCHSTFEWPATVYGQTWIGLTVENPVVNGYVCTVKDPGRQLFLNLGLIPSANPAAVSFYAINSTNSMLLGSLNSSGAYSYGFRVVEELDLYAGVRNKAYYGITSYTGGPILAGNSGTTSVAVTGAAVGDLVKISCNQDLLGCVVTGYVQSAGVVQLRIQNSSGGAVSFSAMGITVVTEKVG